MAPKVVEMSKEFPDVDFLKVDVDDLSDVAADYSIRAMPTFLVFKNGEQIAEVIGANAAKRKPFCTHLYDCMLTNGQSRLLLRKSWLRRGPENVHCTKQVA